MTPPTTQEYALGVAILLAVVVIILILARAL